MKWQIFSAILMKLKSWLSASCALWHIWNKAEAWSQGKNASAISWQALAADSAKAGCSFLCTSWTKARSVMVLILQTIMTNWNMQTRIFWRIIFSSITWVALFCAPLPQMSSLICRSAPTRKISLVELQPVVTSRGALRASARARPAAPTRPRRSSEMPCAASPRRWTEA